MDDLVGFLRAQLDDEAEDAQALADLFPAGGTWDRRGLDVIGVAFAETSSHATHIARWDPARVLAEIEAKRRILDWCEARLHDAEDFPDEANYQQQATEVWVLHLRWLALPYADRDGYRQEWRPAT